MVAREIYIMRKLAQIQDNQFTIKLTDAFVNDQALVSPTNLTHVYLVSELNNDPLTSLYRKKTKLSLD
jgi:adenylate cyclase